MLDIPNWLYTQIHPYGEQIKHAKKAEEPTEDEIARVIASFKNQQPL